MLARDIMTPDVITARPDTPLAALVRTMLDRRISAVPVVADGAVVGIVSEGDLMRRPELDTLRVRPRWLLLLGFTERDAAAYTRTHGRTAGEVMSYPVIGAAEDTPVEEVAALMERHRIKRLPVLRDGRLVGIVARADLLRAQPWAPVPGEVSVLVRDLVVHLWGSVRSEVQRQAVVVAAKSTPGVRAVEDKLAVRRAVDPMDRPNWLTAPPP